MEETPLNMVQLRQLLIWTAEKGQAAGFGQAQNFLLDRLCCSTLNRAQDTFLQHFESKS
jgi:hypothetical protein